MRSRRKRHRASWTIVEFCRRHAISRAHFYRLVERGTGPRILVVGGRRRISREAEADWVVAHEKQVLDRRPRRVDRDQVARAERRRSAMRRPRPNILDRDLSDDDDGRDDGRW